MLEASPLPNLVKMAKFDNFFQKLLNCLRFSKFIPTKGFVPDLVGLLKRFSSIPTGRTQFYKSLTFKIGTFRL